MPEDDIAGAMDKFSMVPETAVGIEQELEDLNVESLRIRLSSTGMIHQQNEKKCNKVFFVMHAVILLL